MYKRIPKTNKDEADDKIMDEIMLEKQQIIMYQYRITKVKNGFVIEFEHEEKGYKDENKHIAKNLAEIVKILKENLTR